MISKLLRYRCEIIFKSTCITDDEFNKLTGAEFRVYCFQLLGTTQNILIMNLAVSNMFLCIFTMPITLLDLIHSFWPLKNGQVYIIIKINSWINVISLGHFVPTVKWKSVSFCFLFIFLCGSNCYWQIQYYNKSQVENILWLN